MRITLLCTGVLHGGSLTFLCLFAFATPRFSLLSVGFSLLLVGSSLCIGTLSCEGLIQLREFFLYSVLVTLVLEISSIVLLDIVHHLELDFFCVWLNPLLTRKSVIWVIDCHLELGLDNVSQVEAFCIRLQQLHV